MFLDDGELEVYLAYDQLTRNLLQREHSQSQTAGNRLPHATKNLLQRNVFSKTVKYCKISQPSIPLIILLKVLEKHWLTLMLHLSKCGKHLSKLLTYISKNKSATEKKVK